MTVAGGVYPYFAPSDGVLSVLLASEALWESARRCTVGLKCWMGNTGKHALVGGHVGALVLASFWVSRGAVWQYEFLNFLYFHCTLYTI